MKKIVFLSLIANVLSPNVWAMRRVPETLGEGSSNTVLSSQRELSKDMIDYLSASLRQNVPEEDQREGLLKQITELSQMLSDDQSVGLFCLMMSLYRTPLDQRSSFMEEVKNLFQGAFDLSGEGLSCAMNDLRKIKNLGDPRPVLNDIQEICRDLNRPVSAGVICRIVSCFLYSQTDPNQYNEFASKVKAQLKNMYSVSNEDVQRICDPR